jgi:hypothetical protein
MSHRVTYYRHNQFHRVDDPAIVCKHAELVWIQYGLPHRINAPSRIYMYRGKVFVEYFIRGNYVTQRSAAGWLANDY